MTLIILRVFLYILSSIIIYYNCVVRGKKIDFSKHIVVLWILCWIVAWWKIFPEFILLAEMPFLLVFSFAYMAYTSVMNK